MTSYDDIIDLPHHRSANRPHMSLSERAAQFSPFAALSGYDEMVREAARRTDKKKDLSEEEKTLLDTELQLLSEALRQGHHPQVTLTVFIPDKKKEGGQALPVSGILRSIDPARRKLIFYAENGISAGKEIEIDQILSIQADPL